MLHQKGQSSASPWNCVWVDGEVRPERDSAQPLVLTSFVLQLRERAIVHVLFREKRKLTNFHRPFDADTSDWQRTLYLSSWKTALTHSFTHPSTHSYTHSLIHPLTHSLTHWLPHSLTHPPIPTCYMYISLLGWRKYLFCDPERPVCDHHLPRAYHSPFAYQPVDQSLRLSFALWTVPTRSFYRRKEKEQN